MRFYGGYGELIPGTMDNFKRVKQPSKSKSARPVPERGAKKRVEELDESGKVVRTFESATQAAEMCRIKPASMVCRIKYKYQKNGHTWRYAREMQDEHEENP